MTLKNIKLIIDNREKDLKGIFPDAEYKNLDLGDIQIKLISHQSPSPQERAGVRLNRNLPLLFILRIRLGSLTGLRSSLHVAK
jgi:hypothetical protein